MIYSVAPKGCPGELLARLEQHYQDDPNVTVIMDRRSGERRGRSRSAAPGGQRRVVRDRRRPRVMWELSTVATADG